jgi:hypothetical protein
MPNLYYLVAISVLKQHAMEMYGMSGGENSIHS